MRSDYFAKWRAEKPSSPPRITPHYPITLPEGNGFCENKRNKNSYLEVALPSLPSLPLKNVSEPENEAEKEHTLLPQDTPYIGLVVKTYIILDIAKDIEQQPLPEEPEKDSFFSGGSFPPDCHFSGVMGVMRVMPPKELNNNNDLSSNLSLTLPEGKGVMQGNESPENTIIWPSDDLHVRLKMLAESEEADYWPLPLG